MEYKNLILPDNAEQLVAMYGPNGDDSPLTGKLHLLESYLRNNLPPQAPQRRELDRRTVTDIRRRIVELKAEIFRSALLEFTRQACEEQRDICLTNFYDAPCGEEAEWIGSSRMPDIYLQGEYERLHDWWNGQAKDRKERIFQEETPAYFGAEEDDNGHRPDEPDMFWLQLSLEAKREIYREYSASLKAEKSLGRI